jgi:hypothetical protein
MSAKTHDKLPLIMSASNTADSGTRTAKYIVSPRRARSLVALSAAGNGGDVVTLNYVSLPVLASTTETL